jgi:hypothetical protein
MKKKGALPGRPMIDASSLSRWHTLSRDAEQGTGVLVRRLGDFLDR